MAACVVIWAAAATLTHLPGHLLPDPKFSDYTLHGLAYFILTLLLWLTLRVYAVGPLRRVLWTAGVTICYGVLDEITQPLFGRMQSCRTGPPTWPLRRRRLWSARFWQ